MPCDPPKKPLCGLPFGELAAALWPLPSFRALQIFKWVARGATDIGEMTDLPKAMRDDLKKTFAALPGWEKAALECKDTLKAAYTFADGITIESVLLKDGSGRLTACLSSQAGCPLGCVFCKTGSGGFIRNLDSSEIVAQFLHLQRRAREAGGGISRIVFMGMGEPLLNLAAVQKAVEVLSDPRGINFSKRRMTLSTSGVTGGIEDLADNGPAVRLALSLVSGDENLRKKLMPGYPGSFGGGPARGSLAQIKKSLAYHQGKHGLRITLEIVLLGGVNTGKKDATAIAEFASGLKAVVNLIPWNPVEGLSLDGIPLQKPSAQETALFAGFLEALGLKVTKRLSKGSRINSACGQLAAAREVAPQPKFKGFSKAGKCDII